VGFSVREADEKEKPIVFSDDVKALEEPNVTNVPCRINVVSRKLETRDFYIRVVEDSITPEIHLVIKPKE